MARLSILLAALLLQSNADQNPRGSIEGLVVQESTDKPIARASVELTVVEGARVISRTATSGDDGRFSFTDLPSGEGYQIVVSAPGLRPTAYGQERPYGPWTPITLAPGQHLTDIRIAAHAVTLIGGKVLDSAGQPAIGASVVAMKPAHTNKRRELQQTASTVTNLRGEYRFTNLPPGPYYIRVSPRNEGASGNLFTNPALDDRNVIAGRTSVKKETEGYPTVYYPGVPIEAAKVLFLEDSQVLDGIDVTITKSDTSRVRGTVTNEATGRRIAVAQVSLLPIGSSPDSNWGRFYKTKDGIFDLRAVLPGKYFLNAAVTAGERPLMGRVAVEILGGRTHTFDIRVSPGTDLSGRIVIENQTATPADLSSLSVSLASDSYEPVDGTLSRVQSETPSFSAPVNADGTFTLHGVTPWDYRVNISNSPGAYVKTVSYGGRDVPATALRVEGNAAPFMEIVLATDGGTLDGRLVGESNAQVVLVPETRRRRDLYFAVSSSSTGRFQMNDIPPGRYKIFAWRNVETGAWMDPDFLERYESQGMPVDIQSESHEYAEIPAIPAN